MKHCIILFFFVILTGCYSKKVFRSNGQYITKNSFFRYPRHQSYSNDNKIVNGVFLNGINDTILKRCFSYQDVAMLKKTLREKKVKFTNLVINKSRFENSVNCVGVFFVGVSYKSNINYETIPLMKFENELRINADFKLGRPINNDTIKIITDINKFREEYNSRFSITTMNNILQSYRYGIDVDSHDR